MSEMEMQPRMNKDEYLESAMLKKTVSLEQVSEMEASSHQHPVVVSIRPKNTTLARLLSFMVPGLGLIYLDRLSIGLRYFLTVIFLFTVHIYLGGWNSLPVNELHLVSFLFLMGTMVTWAASILHTSLYCERHEKLIEKVKEHFQKEHSVIVNVA